MVTSLRRNIVGLALGVGVSDLQSLTDSHFAPYAVKNPLLGSGGARSEATSDDGVATHVRPPGVSRLAQHPPPPYPPPPLGPDNTPKRPKGPKQELKDQDPNLQGPSPKP